MTAPIIGSTSLKHLEDLIDAVHVKLTPEEIEAISKDYKPKAIVRPSCIVAACRSVSDADCPAVLAPSLRSDTPKVDQILLSRS